MTRVMRGALLTLAAALIMGCSRNPEPGDLDPNAPTTVLVENQAFPDMTIYVLEGGRRIRLGLANGNSSTRFVIPKYLIRNLSTLKFQADPIGSQRAPVSDEITVSPGDEVTLRIPPA